MSLILHRADGTTEEIKPRPTINVYGKQAKKLLKMQKAAKRGMLGVPGPNLAEMRSHRADAKRNAMAYLKEQNQKLTKPGWKAARKKLKKLAIQERLRVEKG